MATAYHCLVVAHIGMLYPLQSGDSLIRLPPLNPLWAWLVGSALNGTVTSTSPHFHGLTHAGNSPSSIGFTIAHVCSSAFSLRSALKSTLAGFSVSASGAFKTAPTAPARPKAGLMAAMATTTATATTTPHPERVWDGWGIRTRFDFSSRPKHSPRESSIWNPLRAFLASVADGRLRLFGTRSCSPAISIISSSFISL